MLFFTFEHILIHISFSLVSILITLHFITLVVDEMRVLSNSSERGIIATFFCITGLLITRWVYSKNVPLNDLCESLLFLSWSFSIIHMVPYLKNQKRNLRVITAPSALFTQGFATSGLLTEMHQSTILVPALQSQWLMMHVSMMLGGYAALLCGSLLSIALLVITFRKDIQIFGSGNSHSFLNELFALLEIKSIKYINKRSNSLQNFSLFCGKNYYRSQLIQQLDHWSYRLISLGFIFLTMGILSGAVWANEAWGSYWNWDPKETWAFITWTIFAIYLHTRTNPTRKVQNSAIVASLGFFIIWICYFGVNLLGIGLHSYGSFLLTST